MKTKFADIGNAMSHVQQAKVLMECQECNKSFDKANPNDHTKCPKCGSRDVVANEAIEEGMVKTLIAQLKKDGITSKAEWTRDGLMVEPGTEKAVKAYLKKHAVKDMKVGTLSEQLDESVAGSIMDPVIKAYEAAKKVNSKGIGGKPVKSGTEYKIQQALGKILKMAGYGDLAEGEEPEEPIEEKQDADMMNDAQKLLKHSKIERVQIGDKNSVRITFNKGQGAVKPATVRAQILGIDNY